MRLLNIPRRPFYINVKETYLYESDPNVPSACSGSAGKSSNPSYLVECIRLQTAQSNFWGAKLNYNFRTHLAQYLEIIFAQSLPQGGDNSVMQ